MNSREKKNRDYYASRMLWFGIACVLCAFYFAAPVLFTPKNSLVEIKGTLEKAKVRYQQVQGSNAHKSIKSILLIKLQGDQRSYELSENTGQRRYHKQFKFMEKELTKSGSTTLWIRKSERSSLEPKVFQVATGEGKVLFDIDDAKSKERFMFPFLLIIGFLMIGFYLHHKNPDRFKKLLFRKKINT